MKSALFLSNPIETEHLFLREFVASDWPAILAASSPEAMKFFDEPAYTEDQAKAWVKGAVERQHSDPRMRYEFAVELKSESRVIGYCDLVIREPIEGEMAYSGFRYIPQYWGNGYGTEAELALLEFGFQELGLFRVSMICEPENIGSWRLMEKCGMRREGHETLGGWSSKRNKRVDQYQYAILKEEWEKIKGEQDAE
jgi:RimJ/RimL family protein N-acetyltransferase